MEKEIIEKLESVSELYKALKTKADKELSQLLINRLSDTDTDIMGDECNSTLEDIDNLLDESIKNSELNCTISQKVLAAVTEGADHAYFEGFKEGIRLLRTMLVL